MTSFRSIATAIAFSLAAAPLYGQQRTITLDEALRAAEENNPGIVSARGQLKLTRYNAKPLMFWLPRINFNAGTMWDYNHYSRFDPITNEPIAGGQTSRSYTLGLAGTFSNSLGLGTSKEFASRSTNVELATISYESNLLQLASEITATYNQARQAVDVKKARVEGLQQAEEQFEIVRALMATGGRTVSDSFEAELAIADARVALLEADASLAQAEANLARAVGMDGRVSAVPDTTPPTIVEIDEEALIEEAKKSAPAVQQARLQVRSARLQHGINKVAIFPTLALGFDRRSYAVNPDFRFSTGSTVNVTLGMSIPLFNSGRNSTLMGSRLAVENAVASEADAVRSIEATLVGAIANLKMAAERITIAKKALEIARFNAEIQRRRYQTGSIDIQTLKRAEESLTAQQQAAINAQYAYLNSKASLEAIIGRKL